MKLNVCFLFGAMLSTTLLAQQVTNAPAPAPTATPAPVPAPVTNAPAAPALSPAADAMTGSVTNAPAPKAAKSAKKTAVKEKAAAQPAAKKKPLAEVKTTPLVPGPAVVIASNVNVRGQAKLKSEVVTKVTKEQQVTVLEEIVKSNSAVDEPSAWAKVVLPQGARTWVNAAFIDATNKTVIPRKLNVRSGPGENYSVLATLARGDAVKELATKEGWLQIEPPANAYAFIAAQYLKQEAAAAPPATVAATTPGPAEPATPTPVTEPPAVATAPAEPPATTSAPTEMAATTAPPATDTNVPPIEEEPPPPRIVQREGIVRGSTSIQAPSAFALINPQNLRIIDYLHTDSPYLDLRRYKGLHIIVTGEESLDERWGNTPVLEIQKIVVLDE
jgi:uncharacterized protein YgiM (DUF1202 family)